MVGASLDGGPSCVPVCRAKNRARYTGEREGTDFAEIVGYVLPVCVVFRRFCFRCRYKSMAMRRADAETPSSCRHVGLDHLLYKEGGEEKGQDEAAELRVACFMGFVSFLSGRTEVLRVAPRHAKRLYNAAARAIIQSATLTEAPLTAAGLDGTGEIIQVRLLCRHDLLKLATLFSPLLHTRRGKTGCQPVDSMLEKKKQTWMRCA